MKCNVPACSFLKNSAQKVSLFRPKNNEQLEMWQKVLPTVKLTFSCRICSRHFSSKDIIRKFITSDTKLEPHLKTKTSYLERERPTLCPTAVPKFLLGGNNPMVLRNKEKKNIRRNINEPTTVKRKIIQSIIYESDVNVYDSKIVPCECATEQSSDSKTPFKFYLDRAYNLNLPGLKWRTYVFDKIIHIVHARKANGKFYADKILTLAENKNPSIFLNGVKFMETLPDADLEELLEEMKAVKACRGRNQSGLCSGINRTLGKYCPACQCQLVDN